MAAKRLLNQISILMFLSALTACVHAAGTDIANQPLPTLSGSSVKPNLMFIMDDSGSMDWEHLPDDAGDLGSSVSFRYGYYGLRSSQCNEIYFDPAIIYVPPVYANGTSYPNASFTAALPNGFLAASLTNVAVNLSTGFRAAQPWIAFNGSIGGGDSTGSAAYYYQYNGDENTLSKRNYNSTTNNFYLECNSASGAEPGKDKFAKVPVSTGQRQNFANWYSYYRTRMLLMKTTAGLAFANIDSKYRVGFMTINNNTGLASNLKFVNIKDFDSTQKTAWYAALYATDGNSSTPLRESLAKAGRIYAGNLNASTVHGVTVVDPVQYSCQKNFTILSTDGYWNGNDGYKLDGSTAVGNQDGSADRPQSDGQIKTYTKSTSQLTQKQQRIDLSTVQQKQRVLQLQRSTSTLQQDTGTLQKRTGTLRKNGALVTAPATCTPGPLVTCSYNWGAWSNAASCTVNKSSGAGAWTITSATDCRYTQSGLINTASCTAITADAGPVYTVATSRVCTYMAWTGYVNSTTCVPAAQSAGPNYVGPATQCQTTDTGWLPVASCTVSSTPGQDVTCNAVTTGPTPVATCTSDAAKIGNAWTATVCTPVVIAAVAGAASCTAVTPDASNGYVATICNTVTTGPTTVGSCTSEAASASNNWVATNCTLILGAGGTSDTLADVAQYYYTTDLRSPIAANGTGTCVGPVIAPAITPSDLCANNVPPSAVDTATHQHMTTFTVGLGARGRMIFSPSYLTDLGGDYASVKDGVAASASVCTWQTPGSICNWPVPGMVSTSGKVENIDDLWHAAVNGRGTYFNASNAATLGEGLTNALAGVAARTGSAAGIGGGGQASVADSFIFASNYTSGNWSGNLYRYAFDPSTLTVGTTEDWQAQQKLDDKVAATHAGRIIHTYDPSNAATRLKPFLWGSLSATEQALFGPASVASMTQLCVSGVNCLSTWTASKGYSVGQEYRIGTIWRRVTADYTSGAAFGATDTANSIVITGAANDNLVNFLRGDRTNEGIAGSTKYFRQRAHVLGDIIGSDAVYIRAPNKAYTDTGYAAYKTAQASRVGMVYVGANDGMLHAFKAGTTTIVANDQSGDELWAYIPSLVLPKLYKLADKNYANQHEYFVDGTPTQADVYASGAWRTILVGGLNAGGRGYYALDVTDPAAPKALWEFTYDTTKGAGYTTDANLGYSFGKPVVTKLKDGTWVVLLTSGYNNADGKGYLYVLNAVTGAAMHVGTAMGNAAVTTAVGTPTNPSGLAQISAYADNPTTNFTTKRIYGGDLLGNLWRFDIDDNYAPAGNEATLLATLIGPASIAYPAGKAQPITGKPALGVVSGKPVVFVGTGSLLGLSDLSDANIQSIYAIKDNLSGTGVGSPRADLNATTGFVEQTYTATCAVAGCAQHELVRSDTNHKTVDMATNKGWFADFPVIGDRVNTDPIIVPPATGTTLAFTINTATTTACVNAGYSNLERIDASTGLHIKPARFLVYGFSSAPAYIVGTGNMNKFFTQGDGSSPPGSDPEKQCPNGRCEEDDKQDAPLVVPKLISWRELLD